MGLNFSFLLQKQEISGGSVSVTLDEIFVVVVLERG